MPDAIADCFFWDESKWVGYHFTHLLVLFVSNIFEFCYSEAALDPGEHELNRVAIWEIGRSIYPFEIQGPHYSFCVLAPMHRQVVQYQEHLAFPELLSVFLGIFQTWADLRSLDTTLPIQFLSEHIWLRCIPQTSGSRVFDLWQLGNFFCSRSIIN